MSKILSNLSPLASERAEGIIIKEVGLDAYSSPGVRKLCWAPSTDLSKIKMTADAKKA